MTLAVLAHLNVPGAAIEIVRAGKVEYRPAYGYRDLENRPAADGPDELFTKSATFDRIMARVAGKPLDFASGTRWSYSNTGYADIIT